jgi:hypothetical protein
VKAILATAALVLVAVASPSDWRSVWSIELSQSGTAGRSTLETLQLVLENRGKAKLQGSNAVFSIYRDEQLFSFAVDSNLQSRLLQLAAGQRLVTSVPWASLQFSDLKGKPIAPANIAKAMSEGSWSIVLTVSDDSTPRPDTESNNTVASNTCHLESSP